MNDLLGGILSGLFSISGLVAFGLGVSTVYVWNHVKALTKQRPHRFGLKKAWVMWAVVTLAVLFSMVNTQETWNCMSQFNAALQARTDIAAEDRVLQRKVLDALVASDAAMLTWLSGLLSPPADIAALPPQDPRRREYNIAITNEFNRVLAEDRQIITDARATELANDKERASHPLPELTCGR